MSHICPCAKYNKTFQFSDHLVPKSHLGEDPLAYDLFYFAPPLVPEILDKLLNPFAFFNSRRYKGISYDHIYLINISVSHICTEELH